MQSEKVDLLVKALIKAKSDFGEIARKKKNPFFNSKYADLLTIHTATTPALHKNGILVTQTTDLSGIQAVLVTTLLHESGQFISGNYPLNPEKSGPQGFGSALTYARRYALSAILAVVADDDDDGNAGSKQTAKTGGKEQAASPAAGYGKKLISDAQARRLYSSWKKAHRQDSEVQEHLKNRYGFTSTKEITMDLFDEIEKWINSNEPPFEKQQGPDPEPEIEKEPFA